MNRVGWATRLPTAMQATNPFSGCLKTPHERKNHLNQLGCELSFKHQPIIQPQRTNRSACLYRIAPSHQHAKLSGDLLAYYQHIALPHFCLFGNLFFNIGLIALGEDSRDPDYLGLDCLPTWRDSYQIFAHTLGEDLIFAMCAKHVAPFTV